MRLRVLLEVDSNCLTSVDWVDETKCEAFASPPPARRLMRGTRRGEPLWSPCGYIQIAFDHRTAAVDAAAWRMMDFLDDLAGRATTRVRPYVFVGGSEFPRRRDIRVNSAGTT